MLWLSTLHGCTSISHAKLALRWVLIHINFDPIQEIGTKIEGWHSFKGRRSFARLQYNALFLYYFLMLNCNTRCSEKFSAEDLHLLLDVYLAKNGDASITKPFTGVGPIRNFLGSID